MNIVRNLSRKRIVLVVALALSALATIFALRVGQSRAAVETPDPGLLQGLESHGMSFSPVEYVGNTSITPDEAARVAVLEYGQGEKPVSVYLGYLTEKSRLDVPAEGQPSEPGWEGEAPAPPPAVDRLAFAIRIEGLSLARHGAPTAPEDLHHELVVFVDAGTGQEIVAITFR